MGLAFQVTTPDRVFEPDYADLVIDGLWDDLGVRYAITGDRPRFWSEELGDEWGKKLQERAIDKLGQQTVPHLAWCDWYSTVYVPAEVALRKLKIGRDHLLVGSLPALVQELEEVARILGMPRPNQLADLLRKARSYDTGRGLADRDPEVQAYLQLAITAEEAAEQDLPLWIVR